MSQDKTNDKNQVSKNSLTFIHYLSLFNTGVDIAKFGYGKVLELVQEVANDVNQSPPASFIQSMRRSYHDLMLADIQEQSAEKKAWDGFHHKIGVDLAHIKKLAEFYTEAHSNMSPKEGVSRRKYLDQIAEKAQYDNAYYHNKK